MNFKRDKSNIHPRRTRRANPQGEKLVLRFYVAGRTREMLTAIKNLKLICTQQLNGNYQLTVIDIIKQPRLARKDQILAIPTLKCTSPPPSRSVIGDLSDVALVLAGLNVIDDNTMIRA